MAVSTAQHIHTPQHRTRYGFTPQYWRCSSQHSWRCTRLKLCFVSLVCWQYLQCVNWYVKCPPWGGKQRLLRANCGFTTVDCCVMLCWFPQANSHTASPGGRAVYGVRLQPLARIAGSHPAESMNLLLSCTVAASVKGWALVQRIPTGCEGLIVCHVETSKRGGLGLIWAKKLQRKELLQVMHDGARQVCVYHASCTALPVTQLNTLHHYHGLQAFIVSILSTNPPRVQTLDKRCGSHSQ